MYFNTATPSLTAVGFQSLRSNTGGTSNTAIGFQSLYANFTGSNSVAVGHQALYSNTSGGNNVGIGTFSLLNNLTGTGNIAIGGDSMYTNTTGQNNVCVGYRSLYLSSGSSNNVFVGHKTGQATANTSGSVCVGYQAYTYTGGTNSNQIVIGTDIIANNDNQIRIGITANSTGSMSSNYQGGIRGRTTNINDAVAVLIDSNGQLGTSSSSITKKRDIIDMGDSTSPLLSLRPVRFKWKPEVSTSEFYNYGLIAEEVDLIFPDLVIKDNEGNCETVKYHELAVMLLNELKKVNTRLIQVETQLNI